MPRILRRFLFTFCLRKVNRVQRQTNAFLSGQAIRRVVFCVRNVALRGPFGVLQHFDNVGHLLGNLVVLVRVANLVRIVNVPIGRVGVIFSRLLIVLFCVTFRGPFLLIGVLLRLFSPWVAFVRYYPVCDSVSISILL